jgi:hypothetical protein
MNRDGRLVLRLERFSPDYREFGTEVLTGRKTCLRRISFSSLARFNLLWHGGVRVRLAIAGFSDRRHSLEKIEQVRAGIDG